MNKYVGVCKIFFSYADLHLNICMYNESNNKLTSMYLNKMNSTLYSA